MNNFISESIEYKYLDAYRFNIEIFVRVTIDDITTQAKAIIEADMLREQDTFDLVSNLRGYCLNICELKKQKLNQLKND